VVVLLAIISAFHLFAPGSCDRRKKIDMDLGKHERENQFVVCTVERCNLLGLFASFQGVDQSVSCLFLLQFGVSVLTTMIETDRLAKPG
jgi:hypothetical protein